MTSFVKHNHEYCKDRDTKIFRDKKKMSRYWIGGMKSSIFWTAIATAAEMFKRGKYIYVTTGVENECRMPSVTDGAKSTLEVNSKIAKW